MQGKRNLMKGIKWTVGYRLAADGWHVFRGKTLWGNFCTTRLKTQDKTSMSHNIDSVKKIAMRVSGIDRGRDFGENLRNSHEKTYRD